MRVDITDAEAMEPVGFNEMEHFSVRREIRLV